MQSECILFLLNCLWSGVGALPLGENWGEGNWGAKKLMRVPNTPQLGKLVLPMRVPNTSQSVN